MLARGLARRAAIAAGGGSRRARARGEGDGEEAGGSFGASRQADLVEEAAVGAAPPNTRPLPLPFASRHMATSISTRLRSSLILASPALQVAAAGEETYERLSRGVALCGQLQQLAQATDATARLRAQQAPPSATPSPT